MSTNPTQQAYGDWQAAKTPWYKQQTPTSKANEEQAEAAYTQAVRTPQSSVKFGGQPGAGLAAKAMAQPPKPATPSAPSNSLVAAPGVGAGPGRGSINPTLPATSNGVSGNPLVAAADQQARQVAPGVYEHGRGNYSDNSSGARPQRSLLAAAGIGAEQSPVGMSPSQAQKQELIGQRVGYNPAYDQRLQAGQPSEQNMAAADRLAASQDAASIQRVEANANSQTTPQNPLMASVTATHSGNDWTTRENLRRAKMDATSLIHQSHWAKKGSGQAAQKAYADMQAADAAAMTGGQTGADTEVMKQNAGLMREGMQQAGADRREGRRSLIDMVRLQQDGQRLGMERETQQIQNRPRSLIASLQEQIAAEQDEARRGSLVQRMRDMEGKNAEVDPYLVVPGGQQSNEQGQVYTAPSSVLNRRSGAFLQQPSTAAIPIQNNPKAAEIRSNTSLTREQKVEALRKLGYS